MNELPLPPPPPGTASAIALREITTIARRTGLDTDAALREARVDPATLNDLSAHVSLDAFESVLRALIVRNPDPALPLKMACEAQPGTFGIVSFIAMVAPTLADVIERAVVFERLLGDFASTRSEVRGDQVLMIWDCRLRDAGVRRAMTDGVLAAWVVYARWLLNDPELAPVEVLLAHEEPASAAHRAVYERVFSAPVKFAQAVSGIVMPASVMSRRLRQPDPVVFQALDAHARQRLAGIQADADPVAARVAHAIRECINEDGLPRKERVAERLEMNPRTLLRRLQEQGTTYQDVLDEVRRGLALELARDATLSQEAIATRLGFSDIRSLQRYFRRWTGMTFGQYREQNARG